VGTPCPLCSPYLPEPVEHLDTLLGRQIPRYDHKSPESENPGMELIIYFGLVLSFRTCYDDKQSQVGNPLKKKKTLGYFTQKYYFRVNKHHRSVSRDYKKAILESISIYQECKCFIKSY